MHTTPKLLLIRERQTIPQIIKVMAHPPCTDLERPPPPHVLLHPLQHALLELVLQVARPAGQRQPAEHARRRTHCQPRPRPHPHLVLLLAVGTNGAGSVRGGGGSQERRTRRQEERRPPAEVDEEVAQRRI